MGERVKERRGRPQIQKMCSCCRNRKRRIYLVYPTATNAKYSYHYPVFGVLYVCEYQYSQVINDIKGNLKSKTENLIRTAET